MRKEGSSLGEIAKKTGLTRAGVLKILRNPFYIGIVRFQGELFKGLHQALIPKELFFEVNPKLKQDRDFYDKVNSLLNSSEFLHKNA